MSRTKRLLIVVFSGVAVLLGYRLLHKAPAHKKPPTPVSVRVARAIRTAVPISLRALGIVEAYHTVTVNPMISGPMTTVDFHEGDVVHKGQLLATIDPRPYQAALAQALAKRDQDRAHLAGARDILKRYDLLIGHHYISAEILAQQKAAVEEDQAIVAQDNAAVDTAQTNLSYTRIRAPIEGRTGILQVNAGNIVGPSLTGGIVTITTVQPIFVLFSLPQQDLAQVESALHAGGLNTTAFIGHSADRRAIAHGTLTVLDNVINQATGTLSLKARFKNPRLALWPGAYVDIRLRVRTERNALVVPSPAVRQGPTGSFVYLVRRTNKKNQAGVAHGSTTAHDTAIVRLVHVGFSNQDITVITSGLHAGDDVVVQGGSRLHPHALLRILHAKTPTGPRAHATPRRPM